MTFTLSIELGNDAMRSGADIADVLRTTATLLDDPHLTFDDPADESGYDRNGRLRDANGNTVGAWKVRA